MAIVIDSKMSPEHQEQVKRIVQEFSLDNFKVYFDKDKNALVFDLDRRVVSVPINLIEKEEWKDIRFLFRATLGSANSLWNTTADANDWSGRSFYDKEYKG